MPSTPSGTLPGPSRRITVEPIRIPTHAPRVTPTRSPAVPERPRPERERPPVREPART
jgi:hypothetical protein